MACVALIISWGGGHIDPTTLKALRLGGGPKNLFLKIKTPAHKSVLDAASSFFKMFFLNGSFKRGVSYEI